MGTGRFRNDINPPDLSGLNTEGEENMGLMMYGWRRMLTPPDLTKLNTGKVYTMHGMMANWISMTTPPDLTKLDTSNVENMSYMMSRWESMGELKDIGIKNFDISSLQYADGMLEGTKLSTKTYDDILISWAGKPHKQNVRINFGNSHYTLGGKAEKARNKLIRDGWIIEDLGGIEVPKKSIHDIMVEVNEMETNDDLELEIIMLKEELKEVKETAKVHIDSAEASMNIYKKENEENKNKVSIVKAKLIKVKRIIEHEYHLHSMKKNECDRMVTDVLRSILNGVDK